MNQKNSIALFLLSLLTLSFWSTSLWAQALDNDAFVSADITSEGQIDRYTFNATAGDIVYLTVADVNDTDLTPSLRLFDPGGVEVDSDVDTVSAEINAYEALTTGLHSIAIQDLGFDDFGTYHLRFVRVPGANELGRLQDNTRFSDRLDLGDIDTMTFSAIAGEHIHLNLVNAVDPLLRFSLRLYNPQGELISSSTGISSATLRNIEIDTTGVWTVLIRNLFTNNVGDYHLFFAKVPSANEKGLLPNDARRSAQLERGDIDTWVFNAQEGERVHLSATDIDVTDLTIELFLYGPQGELLDSDTGSQTAFIRSFEIPEDGLFTVLVKDLSANDAGRYELHFARAPGAAELGTLAGSITLQGDITLGDIDTFEFGATAGSTINLNITDLDGTAFRPHVYVYDNEGNVVITARNTFIASIELVAPSTGIYTVVLQDDAFDDAGNYSLTYSYIGATPPAPTSGVVLEPVTWYMLGVPGITGGTLGELFDGTLDLASYGDSTSAGGWIMFGFEATQLNPATGQQGVYRMLSLSEPVPQGTGFWLIHLNDSAVFLSLPSGTTNAIGTTGGGCAAGSSCISTALVTPDEGGWTIGAVPSLQVPAVSTFRFLTSAPAPLCVNGCTLDEAARISYAAPNGFFVYEPSTNQYRLRADTDSIAPWTGFWFRANTAAVPGEPELLIPVE